MKSLFRQIKDLFFCKIGWHDWNDDGQCEHCKTWHCETCEHNLDAPTIKPIAYISGKPIYKEQLRDDRCIHGEFKVRCPICRK